jgi:hypothetical protein
MTMKRRTLACAVAIAALASGVSDAAGRWHGRRLPPDSKVPRVKARLTRAPYTRAPQVVGTLQYDNDVPFRRDAATDHVIGNQFTAGDPHSVNSVSFRLAQNYSGGVIISLWDPDGMGGATRLFQQYVSGIPSNTVTMFTAMAPLTMALPGLTGPFFGGVHNTAYTGMGCTMDTMLNGTCDGVALSAGTMDPGMGFHAFRIPLASGTFTPMVTMVTAGVAPIAGVNALFRATGDNLPVELMQFNLE